MLRRIHLPKDTLCHVWLKLAHLFSRKKLWKNVFIVFSLFGYHLPFEKSINIHLDEFEVRLTKTTLCQVWSQLAERFLRRFPNFVNILCRCHLPLEKAMIFIWTKLNPLYTRMSCAKIGWNWLSGSGEVDVKVCSLCCYYLYLTKGGVLRLKKLKSSSSKRALCQVWLKLTQWLLK